MTSRILSAFLVLFCLTLRVSAQSKSATSNEFTQVMQEKDSVFVYLAEQPNQDSLQAFYSSLATHDIAEKIVFASRMLSGNAGTTYEMILLNAMPISELQLSYVYQLTCNPTGDKKADEVLSDIVSNLPLLVSRLVLTHREYLSDFFLFGYVSSSNGDIGEIFPDCYRSLLEKDCSWFLRNLLKANPRVEASVLDAFHLSPPSASWVKAHKSEIPEKYLSYFESLSASSQGDGHP